jgi:hypothetical protein
MLTAIRRPRRASPWRAAQRALEFLVSHDLAQLRTDPLQVTNQSTIIQSSSKLDHFPQFFIDVIKDLRRGRGHGHTSYDELVALKTVGALIRHGCSVSTVQLITGAAVAHDPDVFKSYADTWFKTGFSKPEMPQIAKATGASTVGTAALLSVRAASGFAWAAV